ncbi:carboxypeptidase regulatory-like domain-containing protein [Flavobacterium sp. LS1R10]|uniref:TonB-dependent receptor n=1 Tax=Flavobacterium sp. LS1R10 TaxID=2497482 RepID=UPI000F844195|nr:carboxypeptidase regulatory-like domain-containing protein [Flavobacterium sp. LS1R10]RTY76191.1 TonB-dependent receptor [Flavobacterium sp. LS1R10]
MKKFLKLFFALALLFCANPNLYAQGNTNSSVSGNVYDNDSQTLPGASILAVHTPSGSRYTASTDGTGNFSISNMRVGGPYKITITYVGFRNHEENEIYLQLGENKTFKIALAEESNQLKEVVVRSARDNTFNSQRTGAQTVINSDKINSLPSLSRNISDFARLTPQAQIRGDDQLSIGGQNNRFNAIYIDGAVSNDVFGLAANGTNGGQTGVSPISVDAIEQFQVSVAPYDVKLSGFAGGAISAITKSGTNDFEGSAYFFNRDESISAKTPPSLAGANGRQKLADFSAQTYGVRAGGSIVKDKLFYFINYEKQNNETPQPFEFGTYTGSSTLANIAALTAKLAGFGYDPGSYNNNVRTLKSDKIIAKLDWNISDNHKLSLKHSIVDAENFAPSRSSATAISFINGSQLFNSRTTSTALELNSRFSNKFSNNLVVAYTKVVDDRDASGSPFPTVQIRDGAGNIFFGAEAFSTANLLDQQTLTISDNFEINLGRNKITIGTHNEFSQSKNVFFGNNFGAYRYDNLADFLGDKRPNRFLLNYSLIGGSGDESLGAAEFGTKQFGLYVQNDMRLTENFKLSYGVRVDMPVWEDGLVNNDFNVRTVGLLQAAGKNLKDARVGQGISNYAHFAPRLGFNYDVNGAKLTQIRGGFGVFTSRLPLVWPGGTYNNNGVTQGAIQITGTTNTQMPVFNPNPSVDSQIAPLPASFPRPGSGSRGGNIDIFAKDFKLPQVFKASFAVDQKLPLGFVFTSEITYNDNISAIKYENLNVKASTSNLTGADTRPTYNANNRVDSKYLGIYLASNTDEGKAYNVSFTLTKNFRSPFIDGNISGTYSYGKSTVLLDATSSQNSSQWNNTETVNGANFPTLSRSDFDQGVRIISNGNVTLKWSKFTKSRIGFFYEGAQGTPISYVYNDFGNLLKDTFSNSALIYVPAARSEINLVSTTNGLTADQQWDALSAFIEGNEYLRSRKGGYAERNGDRLKTTHVVDLKFAQEFTINVGNKKHTLEFTADIFNFTNLLNKNWGKRYFTSFDQVQLLQQVGFLANGTTPTFRYNPAVGNNVNQVDDVGLNSSRWQMQTGVRYTFN